MYSTDKLSQTNTVHCVTAVTKYIKSDLHVNTTTSNKH